MKIVNKSEIKLIAQYVMLSKTDLFHRTADNHVWFNLRKTNPVSSQKNKNKIQTFNNVLSLEIGED